MADDDNLQNDVGGDDAVAVNDDDYHTYDDHFKYNDDFVSHAYQLDVESKETSSLYFILFSTLLFAVLVMSKYLHEMPKINKYLSEASLILIVGLIFGFLTETFIQYEEAYYENPDNEESDSYNDASFQRLISFSPNIFFMALLPPILFNSGYQLRRELFLQHIYPIVMFAAMGTIISTIVCAMGLWGVQQLQPFEAFDPTLLELFAFGSLIAATDTVSVIAVLQAKRVDPHLFYVVFGESALNDAVALVLFNSFADLLRANKEYSYEAFIAFFPEFFIDAVGSPLLGMVFGFLAALLFKGVDMRKKKYRMLELSLYLMLMYVPFIIAESIHLSGIVTIFFAGLSVRRYVAPNVSKVTEKAGATIFQLVAFLSETCIFLELGLSIFGFSGHFHWDFIIYSLVCCLLARGAAIYPLALLHNFAVAREQEKLSQTNAEKGEMMDYVPPVTSNGDMEAPTTFGQHHPQNRVPPTVEVQPIGSLDDPPPPSHQDSPDYLNYSPPRNYSSPPRQRIPRNPEMPPDGTTPTAQNVGLSDGLQPPQQSPLPEHEAVEIPPEVAKLARRSKGNSFDSEDSHNSRSTVTTHQSRKRRERRGRLMNNVKKERISWEMMHILWFAGLRGAVAYACVREFPDVHGNADRFTAATMFIVLFTIVVMGGLTESLLGWLGIEMGVDLEEYMDIFRQEQELTGAFHDFERTYIYNVATRKPEGNADTSSNSSGAGNQNPPVFLGVDSNAFRSMTSAETDYYAWSGFEMTCFPGWDYYADHGPNSNNNAEATSPSQQFKELPNIT